MDRTSTRAEKRDLDKFFRALSHPVRREILLILDSGARHVGDIAAEFDMVGPAISRHLGQLFEANLVSSERRRQYVYYSLEREVMMAMVERLFGRL